MRAAFERLGCAITGEGDCWTVEGRFVDLQINVANGQVLGMSGWFGNDVDLFNRAVEAAEQATASGTHAHAEEERKRELRKTHRWDNRLKAWAPISGVGPVIRKDRREAMTRPSGAPIH